MRLINSSNSTFYKSCKYVPNSVFQVILVLFAHKLVILSFLLFFIVIFSSKHIFNKFYGYPVYVPDDQVLSLLLYETTPSVDRLAELPECDYRKIVFENEYFYETIFQLNVSNLSEIKSGGEFIPLHCKPKFSTAIIIPYRNREIQLKRFITYIHHFLRQQHIHYRIFLIEQADDKAFNRAKLFNIGAVYATKMEYPCLIFHDVDLIPLHLGNLYVCTKQPRHMAVNMDKYGYNLFYMGYVGGSISMPATVYQSFNGMSNLYFGWGAEDDDLYERLQKKHIEILRFGRKYSQYIMMKHKQETPSKERHNLLNIAMDRIDEDGLNSLKYKEKSFELKPLYTHISVEL